MLTSFTEHNVSYVDALENTLDHQILSLDRDDWFQFLLDHREQIRSKATTIKITDELMLRYRYRILDFLNEVHSFSQGGEQAFRIINRLYNDMDFNDSLTEVYIPDAKQLQDLRARYQTCISKEKKL